MFRGYILQLVGSWTRFAIIPVVVSVPLFVAGHTYELWGLVDVGIFGLTAAVLTIRTGGLEAGIAAHTANNVVLFVLDALGMISATDDSGAGPLDLIPTIISSARVPGLGRVGCAPPGVGADPTAHHAAADTTGAHVAAASVRLLVASGPARPAAAMAAGAATTPAGVATAARAGRRRDAPCDPALPG